MRLKLVRTTFTDRSTIGELFVNDAFECFTLEDMVRPVKVPGMTAIPAGTYVVTVSFSSRFKRLLPEIHSVPQFTGVRIHAGNTDADTEGCVLLGTTKASDFIGNSRGAFNKVFERIQAAAQREKIFLEITSSGAQAPAGLGPLSRAAAGLTDEPATPARLALVRRAGKRKSVKRRAGRAARASSKAKRAPRKATRRPKGRRRR